ncbi:MAG: hypothetical protein IPJ52_01860 [Rhodocyclaceae bacterium]|nr:hypothetical protein [Rhodocyclaceae bacterium]
MSIGSPIVFGETQDTRQFIPLAAISTRRDDPNSFDEDLLQELIDATPNILPIRDFLPSTSALFALGREVAVDIGGSEGFIDNLLVTNDGYLVIVETKLYRNPEATRDVVTQTLQYGMSVGRMPLLELRQESGVVSIPHLGEMKASEIALHGLLPRVRRWLGLLLMILRKHWSGICAKEKYYC